ncbi:hypothetical protein [Oxobacter pfennigii]|nr:hypothetical protein [Oxobacter pfennigii]
MRETDRLKTSYNTEFPTAAVAAIAVFVNSWRYTINIKIINKYEKELANFLYGHIPLKEYF